LPIFEVVQPIHWHRGTVPSPYGGLRESTASGRFLGSTAVALSWACGSVSRGGL